MSKLGSVVSFVGLIYLSLGLSFVFLQEEVFLTNINIDTLMPVINGISIASLLFALSDFFDEVILNRKYEISLKKILDTELNNITDELELFKVIDKGYQSTNEFAEKWKFLNKLYYFVSNITFLLSTYALPISILLTLVYFNIDAYVSTGINLIVFGLFIIAYACKENRKSKINILITRIWMEFYKKMAKTESEV